MKNNKMSNIYICEFCGETMEINSIGKHLGCKMQMEMDLDIQRYIKESQGLIHRRFIKGEV